MISALLCYLMFCVHSIRRLVSTIQCTAKSVTEYWSRLGFRVMMLLWLLVHIGPFLDYFVDIPERLDINPALEASNQAPFILAVIFLVKSLQDFSIMTHREPSFIYRYWGRASIPAALVLYGLLLVATQLYRCKHATAARVCACTEVALVYAVCVGFVFIPGLVGLREIAKHDCGTLTRHLRLAVFEFVLAMVVMGFLVGIFIWSFNPAYDPETAAYTAMNFDAMVFAASITQSLIDSILRWMNR